MGIFFRDQSKPKLKSSSLSLKGTKTQSFMIFTLANSKKIAREDNLFAQIYMAD